MNIGEEYTIGHFNVTVKSLFTRGDICDLYHCEFADRTPAGHRKNMTRYDFLIEEEGADVKNGLVKVSRDIRDNDLAENEYQMLTRIYPETAKDEKFYRYFVHPLAGAMVGGTWATLMTYAKDYVSLADVSRAYPNGIDFRDMAWMLRRTLEGIGFVHHNKAVHGAIIPEHILVHPVSHGAKIIDWSYAVASDHRARAMVGSRLAFYPPEVARREDLRSETDLFMIGKCVLALLGGNVETNEMPAAVPNELQALITELLDDNRRMRPHSAWDLYDELDNVLFKLCGKRAYRPFHMPSPVP